MFASYSFAPSVPLCCCLYMTVVTACMIKTWLLIQFLIFAWLATYSYQLTGRLSCGMLQNQCLNIKFRYSREVVDMFKPMRFLLIWRRPKSPTDICSRLSWGLVCYLASHIVSCFWIYKNEENGIYLLNYYEKYLYRKLDRQTQLHLFLLNIFYLFF